MNSISRKMVNVAVTMASGQSKKGLIGMMGPYSYRTLYSKVALGIDGYERQRNRTVQQFSGMDDKFREKMRDFAMSDTKNMIFTEDLKNMVHMTDAKPDDLILVLRMMKRFNQQNRHLRFGNYVFGPVVMRMYHYLNQPDAALETFKDEDLDGFFDQLASYQVLCDLLYSNKMYQQVLDVFEIIKTKRVEGTKFPRNISILVAASCYKMNSVESYEYVLKMLNEMKEVGVDPVRKFITYSAALALNQNAPQIALEILSNAMKATYVSVRNLKLQCFADLGRPDDALPILRMSLEFDNPAGDKRASVCKDVFAKVKEAVGKLGNKEVSMEFERLEKALVETNQLTSESLEDIIDSEITVIPRGQFIQDGAFGFQRQQIERSFRMGPKMDLRPRRNPLYDRERRSMLSE